MVAEDEDGGFFVELLVGAAGDFVHGDEGGAFDVGGLVFPGLADVEEEGRVVGGEEGFGLGDGDFVDPWVKDTGVGGSARVPGFGSSLFVLSCRCLGVDYGYGAVEVGVGG